MPSLNLPELFMPLPATAAKSQSGRKPATDGFNARCARRCRLAAWVLRPSCTFARLSRVDRSAHNLLALLVVPQPSLPTYLNSGFVARFWKIDRAFQRLDQLCVDDSAWCSADFAFWELSSPPRTSSILSATSTRSFSVDLPACKHHPQTLLMSQKTARGSCSDKLWLAACRRSRRLQPDMYGASSKFRHDFDFTYPAPRSSALASAPTPPFRSSSIPISRSLSNPRLKPSSFESITTRSTPCMVSPPRRGFRAGEICSESVGLAPRRWMLMNPQCFAVFLDGARLVQEGNPRIGLGLRAGSQGLLLKRLAPCLRMVPIRTSPAQDLLSNSTPRDTLGSQWRFTCLVSLPSMVAVTPP
ncbi:hypothetical protein C8R45DRAFT_118919 [Mycena sanguinolenta]|nr:hypothetical protein C8R45DRAFT_118919 [Mycena sanguinolenta]